MKVRGIRKFGAVLALVASLGLASCGGGEQVSPFAPNRLLAFGDENSVIDSAGRKYTINALNATSGALDCVANPLWIQSLATVYGLVFPECNPSALAATSRILATPGATAAGLKTQIDNFIAGGGVFTSNDLVTVWVGQNDIFADYATYPTQTATAIEADLTARGAVMAQQVNRIAALGGRVVVGKVQNLGLTAFGYAQQAAQTDGINRQELLKAFTLAFNNGFLNNLVNDGQHTGLFDPDAAFNTIAVNPGVANLINVSAPACMPSAALPNCSSATLVSGATSLNYLWADDRHLGPAGHVQMSTLAYSRSKGNPF